MRHLLLLFLSASALPGRAQYDAFSYRYTYTFVEDSNALVPLQGKYTVEYLARGQWWSYMPPHTPVDYPGERKVLKPLFEVNGSPVMVVETGYPLVTTDHKLRVVRGADTLIVDIRTYSDVEQRMRERTAKLGKRPRPPVLFPFRKGWFNEGELSSDPITIANTVRFDALWMSHRTEVLAAFDTARYAFDLEMDALRTGALERWIMRDPNYVRHLVHFPASGPGTHFELYRQDSTGVASTTMSLRVDMPADGGTGQWVDITDLRSGKYSTYLKWGEHESVFYLIIG
ncbi:MAG: hypothetical protein ABI599_11745 [Flavobacteriales bacterium]